jgi:HK97 family phage portal protein
VGLLENIKASGEEQRVIGGVPWMPWTSPYMRFDAGGPVHPTRAFTGVEHSLGLPALYSGAKLLGDNAASLPLRVYQRLSGQGPRQHSRYYGPTIFDKPSVVGTQFDWIFSCMVSMVLQGNAWGYITGRDGYGFPTGIEWIPPEDVHVMEPHSQQSWNPLDGRVFVFGRECSWYGPDAELFHIPAFKLPGRIEGLSVLRAFALTITSGHSAQQYGADWYAAGGFPPGTFQNAEIEIDATAAAEIRAELVKSLRRREPLVYGRDWDYKPVTVPPSEAQFIDAMQLTATQIAAILNLPPDRIGGSRGDSLTYNTVEMSALQVIESLRPWLTKMEQAYFDLLPRNRFTKFWTDSLLRTDLATRMNIYQVERNIGFRTSDEQREIEDLDPLPNGIGTEAMPLTLMNAMGTRAGAIPKSLMKSIVLEMDIATDRLTKLEKTLVNQAPQMLPQGPNGPVTSQNQGVAPSAPGNGSQAPQPGQSNMPQQSAPMTTGGKVPIGKPNAPLPLTQDPASFLASLIGVQRNLDLPYEVRAQAQELWVSILDRKDRIESLEPEMSEPIAGSDLWAPVMHARGVREIVEGSPTMEERAKHKKTVDMGQNRASVKTQVYAQLTPDFPAKDLTWVNEARWSGPVLVPMNELDTHDREQWVASHNPELVAQKSKKLRKRLAAGKTQLKDPIVAVEGPDGQKVIADGHHRYLSLEQNGQDHALCYIGHVSSNTGPWSAMGADQHGGPSGAELVA